MSAVMTESLYEFMKSPLVWPAWYTQGTDLTTNMKESPSKELPTKTLKQRRTHDRQDIYLKKKSAGTQTTYSNWRNQSQHSNGYRSPSRDSDTSPLNLSNRQPRPSVICAPSTNGNSQSRDSCSPPLPGRREVTTVDMCDPAIEEHFRRSLGKNYPECLSSASQTSPRSSPSPVNTSSKSPSPVKTNVLQTGSVDDHFAKSLGTTWTELQVKREPVKLDVRTSTVDDHFTKALGNKWLEIKAENERKSPSPTPTATPQSAVVS